MTAWIRDELNKIHDVLPHSVQVEKLTGVNSRLKKERVMQSLKKEIVKSRFQQTWLGWD